jgi:hypothetical protein
MSKFGGKLFDRYDDTVKVGGSRKDFPTCTVMAVCNKVTHHETDDGMDYLKAHFTVLVVEKGDETEPGQQHTIAFFKRAKTKFFERDTKDLARSLLGLDKEEGSALKTAQVMKTLESGASGVVLRIRAKRTTQESKKEEGKTVSYTNVEYLGRCDKAEILAAIPDKAERLTLFPKGIDAEGRGIGFGEDEGDEDEAPAPKAKGKKAAPVEEDEDEDVPAPRKAKKKPAPVDETDEDEDEA